MHDGCLIVVCYFLFSDDSLQLSLLLQPSLEQAQPVFPVIVL